MAIDTATIQKLREATGAGIMDAKNALQEAKGDYDKAIENLRKQGQKIAAKKQSRQVKDGTIGYYVHSNGKVAAFVGLACETDFVAKTEDFQSLAHELAMHVTASQPQYVEPSEIPEDVIAKEKEVLAEQLKKEGKPEAMLEKIMEGKLEKFYSEVCLLKQPFVKDDKKTIEDLMQEAILKLGENIQIAGFHRMAL